MTTRTTFLVQAYEIKRRQLTPMRPDTAPTESGAIRRAEAMAARAPTKALTIAGTAALKIVADDETGDVQEAAVLASFGQVPDDLADQIRGG